MQAVADVLVNLSNVLPTGTLLVFQALAPSETNNGLCGVSDKLHTRVILVVLYAFCFLSCFTDSYTAENGVLYYGVVTPRGLWNPKFANANITGVQGCTYTGGGRKYELNITDLVNAVLSPVALFDLTLLTAPVTTCFFPHIAGSILKTVSVLVGLVVGAILNFTNVRRGIGFAPPDVRP